MSKITWDDRTNSGSGALIDASIFNEIKTSVNDIYENDISLTGSITISGNIIPSSSTTDVTSSFDLGSPTSAWRELYVSTASINFVASNGAITKFTKADVTNLKAGKSLNTGDKQIVHESDDTTFVQMKSSAPGRVRHLASNVALLDIRTSSFDLGNPIVPMVIQGSTLSITGSTSNTGSFDNSGSFSNEGSSSFTGSFDNSGSFSNEGSSSFSGSFGSSGSFENTGSFNSTGSFAVNNLLDLLANFGQTGIPTGSGEGGVAAGDINLDGQVNVTDMLLLLAGYGNPNIIVTNTTIPPNVNHQFVGPELSISSSITLSVSTGSFCSITL